MQHGFIKVAAVTPKIKVADPSYNAKEIIARMIEAAQRKAKIIVFPELCLTGYTCNDLFLQDCLLEGAKEGLSEIVQATQSIDALVWVGLPLEVSGKLYNVADCSFFLRHLENITINALGRFNLILDSIHSST